MLWKKNSTQDKVSHDHYQTHWRAGLQKQGLLHFSYHKLTLMNKLKTIAGVAGVLKKPLVFMNLTFILMLVCCTLPTYAGASAQTITLNAENKEISKVLSVIEKQGDFRFLFNSRLQDLKQKVSVNFKDADINTVLQQLFKGTRLTFLKMDNNLIAIRSIDEVSVVVSGKVTSEAGVPLSGVSVLVKGGTGGTKTDAAGNFSINVADNAVLMFSAVGYDTQEVGVAGRSSINVTMALSNDKLDEVVVVGYGTQKKRDLTGSISSVSGEEVARMPNTNPVSSLQGKVAGLTVANSGRAGSSPVVRIRGINSTNSASPVYVVDGILQDNIDYLNPADIESIDVLRDPSSIAIYGLRGANGVIAVTSKKAARGKTRISLQSSVGIQKVNDIIAVTDAAGFKKLYDQQIDNIQLTNPSVMDFDYTGYTGNTNWQDEVLRSAIINTNNISIANSGEKSTTYLNLGYTTQDGVLKNDNFQRFLIRLNEEIKFNNNLKVGANITGYHSISNPPTVSITNALWAAPIVPIQFDENIYYSMPSFQRAQVGNPISTLNRNDRTSINKGYRVVGSIFAEIKFLQNFTWKSTLYTDMAFNTGRNYNPLPFAQRDIGENGQPDVTVFPANVNTSISQSQSESKRFQQDHTLTFDKKYNAHQVTALAGFTTIFNSSSFINGNRRDTAVNIPRNPDYWYINISNLNNPGNFGGGGGENSIVGAFGRVSYAFNNRYLLNATIRRDGSSKFAPENRWGTFGSVGAGWVVSDERFFNDVKKQINYFKLRGAWGITGNSNGIEDNIYKPRVSNASTAVFGDNVYTSIQAAFIPDPNLKFETVQGTDIGFDLKAMRNRFNAEVTYYNRTTTDILTAVELPNETRRYFTNLGKITNKGIEVSMGWNDKISRDFTYGISGNFSYNKNTVNAIGDNIDFNLIGNGGANLTQTGQSIGYFYGYRQVGIYQSTADLAKMPAFTNSLPGDIAYEDVNGDGKITTADRTYLGTPFPVYNFGGVISLGYKGFDFQAELQGVAGNKIYTQRRTLNFAVLNYEANRLNAWTAPGTSNIEPILDNRRGNNYLFSSYYLEPGDYLRIRTLQLGYTLSNNVMSKIGLQKARVFVSGQNIVNWSQVTGYSPEAQIGSILGGGADNGAYPVPAVYTVGFNVTF